MFDNLPFNTTLKRLMAFEDYVNSQPGENTQLIIWELKAFEAAKEAFIETYRMKRLMLEKEYELELLSKVEEHEDGSTVDTECNKALMMMDAIDENNKLYSVLEAIDKNNKLYSEIKDVQHDDEGYPFVKTGEPDSDSGLSSDSDLSGKDEEIPMPTKKRIIRRKPKN